MVTDDLDRQLGVHTHVYWARWDASPASSFAQWQMSRLLERDTLAQIYVIPHVAIDASIPDSWT